MKVEKIKEVMQEFAAEARKVYGSRLYAVILYGSCARGDFAEDSDIDVMVLLDVAEEELGTERNQIIDIANRLDWDYDVVLAPVLQNYKTYEHYLPVSVFYQNIQKEGIKIA